MNTDVDDIVRSLAPDPGPGLTPGAREMLTQIMDDAAPLQKPLKKRRRWAVALPIAATVAAWALPTFLTASPAAAALDVKEEGDHYVIEVKDLYAKPEVYESRLRGLGLKVSLKVVPVSPSFVGEISTDTPGWKEGPFPYADKIKTIDRPEQCGRYRQCPIGVTIAKDFTAQADILLGREGRPGEEYQASAGLHDDGEPLHCQPFYNRPVSEVRERLKELGVSVREYAVKRPGERGEDAQVTASVPDSMYVMGGGLASYGTADLVVSETPMDGELLRTILGKEGCGS
ncbi:hypothetical protein ACFPOI_54930 [Nonomuraea angiospora]|uniref:Uncharacterized protein n=1 Tax=Nonomuraea angiospora TaxID=46172 RepID=A0ABR9M722_9ACTN|nr:hypothetical protein [Nonomuraea angiospora]MBE1588710.1 hypothetical protein [Nonomuraea angiospora]